MSALSSKVASGGAITISLVFKPGWGVLAGKTHLRPKHSSVLTSFGVSGLRTLRYVEAFVCPKCFMSVSLE
jgi:hypothetical protein